MEEEEGPPDMSEPRTPEGKSHRMFVKVGHEGVLLQRDAAGGRQRRRRRAALREGLRQPESQGRFFPSHFPRFLALPSSVNGSRLQNVKTPQTTKHTASTLALVSILLYCVIDELQCSHCVTVETGPHVRHWRQLGVRSLALNANDLGQVL